MDDLILLQEEPLDETALRRRLGGEEDGAVVTFAGVVRRLEGEVPLRAIDYQAYGTMARRVLSGMLAEAHARGPRFQALIAHRTGVVPVGETSVWIGVAAGHRAEAFEVCRWLIDQLKVRVPIWKRDHLPRDGA